MPSVKSILIPFLVAASQVTLAQNISSVPAEQDRARILATRLQIVRGFLVAAEMPVPDRLDSNHLPELRADLQAWLQRQEQGSPAIQEVTSSTGTAAEQTNSDEPKPKVVVGDLRPGILARVGRFGQFKAEAQEQAKTVLVGSSKTQVPNPDHVIWKESLTFNFNELVLSSSDLSAIYSGYAKVKGADQALALEPVRGRDGLKNPDCAEKDFVSCMRRVRPRDFFSRGLSGLTASLSYAQNPRFQQGGIFASSVSLWGGEIDFDATKLFPNGSDWGSVGKALSAFKLESVAPCTTRKPDGSFDTTACPKSLYQGDVTDPCPKRNPDGSLDTAPCLRSLHPGDVTEPCPVRNRDNDNSRDSLDTATCLKTLLGRDVKHWYYRSISAVVPTFTFKVQTQFDLIKNSAGQFQAPLFPEDHLWYMSFTTDLRRAIETIKSKTDALDYVKAANDATKATPPCNIDSSLPPATVGSLVFYSLDEDETERKWKLEGSCERLPSRSSYRKSECAVNGISIKKNGTLVGYPLEARETFLKLSVSDVRGQKCSGTARITVMPKAGSASNAGELALDYLQIAASPEILLDDKWFDGFLARARVVIFPIQGGEGTLAAQK